MILQIYENIREISVDSFTQILIRQKLSKIDGNALKNPNNVYMLKLFYKWNCTLKKLELSYKILYFIKWKQFTHKHNTYDIAIVLNTKMNIDVVSSYC